jgi:endonuclease/exonuclease/phosphatase family metal-dependent hydrolase
MDVLKILIWNVRGLNRKARCDVVRDLIGSCRPNIVYLQETKKEAISHRMVLSMLGADFDEFIVLLADGFSVSAQFAHDEGSPWWFTGVYGPQSDTQKIQFIQELCQIRQACNGPWSVGGDFNLIYQAEDKNNANLDRAMMGRFRCFLNDMELKEIPLLVKKYAWSNEREAPTWLNHVFVTDEWDHLFPDRILQSSASMISDHCLLLLGLHEFTQGRRRFHFESFWPRLEGFVEEVTRSWNQQVEVTWLLQVLADKLNRLSSDLQSWGQRKVGHIKQQL